MQDGTPYWELGRTDSPGDITKKPEKLEEDLIKFVNEHPETFNPEEMERMRRGITRAFAMFSIPFRSTEYAKYKPGLSCIAQLILQTISDKVTKGREINTTHEVKDAIDKFDVCVEFIDKFLSGLCATEEAYTQSGNGGFIGSNKWKCELIADAVKPNIHFYPNIFRRFQEQINRYQSRVLKLWADVLIREGKITPTSIAEMQAAVTGADGYERKMRELLAECDGRGNFKPNLDESMLLKWITLFYVAIEKDVYLRELTKTYSNVGSLDRIIFGIISQFIPIHNVYNYSYIPQSNKHNSELNILHLICNVIEKNPQTPQPPRPPIIAYLSSDMLDQCVQNVGHFPTTDEFIQYLNTRMIEKAAAFAPPPPPPSAPPPSAPPLSELADFGGGKKTRRKTNKQYKKCKKSRRHRRH